MALDEFEELDERLERAFAGISAPSRMAAAVMRRVRTPAPTRLPEFLDGLGWAGILAFTWCVAFFVIIKK